MSTQLMEVVTSYTVQTTGVGPSFLNHDVTQGFGGQDLWGHWTVRGTARIVGGGSCKHFYQRVSGIWTGAASLILTGVQPAMEVETAVAAMATGLTVTASGDNIVLTCTGIAATTINWFITVKTHNVYAEN